MALYQTVTYTTTGTKDSLALDPSIAPFNSSIVATLTGTGNYKIQYSLDKGDVADADATWTDAVNIPAGTTASAVTSIISPVSRIRAVIASLSGSLQLQVAQGYTNN